MALFTEDSNTFREKRSSFAFPKGLLGHTQIFTIEREKRSIGSAHGFFCGSEHPSTIQLVENADIKNGDWMIDSLTQQRYFVKDANPIVVNEQIVDWMVKYQTEHDYQSSETKQRQTTINIQNVSGNSIIGSQENAIQNVGISLHDIEQLISNYPDQDKAIAQELLSELEEIEKSKHPVLVKGMLSKFSDFLQKHSNLITAIGGWAVQLLVRK